MCRHHAYSGFLITQATLVNLSAELNQTHLVLPERLQEAADMLAALQDMSEQNQELVDMLTDEVIAI